METLDYEQRYGFNYSNFLYQHEDNVYFTSYPVHSNVRRKYKINGKSLTTPIVAITVHLDSIPQYQTKSSWQIIWERKFCFLICLRNSFCSFEHENLTKEGMQTEALYSG
jgi:hypothetical protein